MNEEQLRDALRAEAGTADAADIVWRHIVEDGEARARAGARRSRPPLAFAAALVALVVAAVGVVVVGAERNGGDGATEVRVGVPSVTGGSADLVVESSSYTDEGARRPVGDDVARRLAKVTGVRSVVGVVRTVARLQHGGSQFVPVVAVSWDGGDGFRVVSGRAPERDGEVALTATAARSLGVERGDDVRADATARGYRVVGTFALAQDDPAVALAAVTLDDARHLSGHDGYTRLHVRVSDGADPETVAGALVAAAPDVQVVGVSQLGTIAQLRDELAIQAAYFDMLSADPAVRAAAVEGGADTPETRSAFERYRDSAAQATLRIQRYSFLDADHAAVTFVIYYGTSRSPIITDAQSGMAVRVDGRWKVANTTRCALANLISPSCAGEVTDIEPPAGWARPETQPGAVAAFRTLADPAATVDERVAAVVDGDTRRGVVAVGVERDARYAGAVTFHVSGVRRRGADQVEVLYSVTTTGARPLETPYPLIGRAVRVDGAWRANGEFACGLTALVNPGSC